MDAAENGGQFPLRFPNIKVVVNGGMVGGYVQKEKVVGD